jgi:hypothetical protein
MCSTSRLRLRPASLSSPNIAAYDCDETRLAAVQYRTAHPPMETANRRSCRPSSGLTIHCPLKCLPETSQAALHPRVTLPHTVRSASNKPAVIHCDGCAEWYLLAVVGRTVQWLLDCHCRMTSKPRSHSFGCCQTLVHSLGRFIRTLISLYSATYR